MGTPQLHDPGERDWDLKLHIGCGSIYLTGYTNLDIMGFHPHEREDLLRQNTTDIRDYYGRKGDVADGAIQVPPPSDTVLDGIADMRDVPYSNVSKIVCIQAFEHLTKNDAKKTLLSWWNALKPGGTLIISVPDPIETTCLLMADDPETRKFALRHLMGSDHNTYALHHWAYTEEALRELLLGYGFEQIERLKNIHFYPAIVLKARKADPRCAGREYQRLPTIEKGWKVLDIGPGHFPLPSATWFLDIKRFPEPPGNLRMDIFDLNSGKKLPYEDDYFDFVYCSHVLEHLDRPVEVLKEIQRIGQRGYVEIPSVLVDFMFQHGRTHPKWACWGYGGTLLFIEKTEDQKGLFKEWGESWGGFFHGAVHGSRLTETQRQIRFFFWERQPFLNISASWDKTEGTRPIHGQEMRL